MFQESIKLNIKEHNYIPVLKKITEGILSQNAAAVKLNISKRHMVRLVARFHKGGAESIAHRGQNKPSLRKLPEEKKDKILFLVNAYYSDYSAVFAAESLQKYHDLTIHPEALRRLLKPSKQRKMKKHRQWRERKRHYGEMIQVDGSLHNWFEERGPQLTLLAYIDDATSTIMYLRFVKRESVESLMTTTRLYIEKHGKPLIFYPDRGSTFKVNNNNPDRILKTQFERALQKLDITLIHARSPQAKR